jgi:hypothetical protein
VIGDSNLRIVGKGFPSSAIFGFKEMSGDVTLHVQPGNNAALSGGIAAVVVGGLAIIAGAITIPLNQAISTTTDVNTGVSVHMPNPALRGPASA